MGWKDLIQHDEFRGYVVFPWIGERKIHKKGRSWKVVGDLPREFGWYLFELTGARTATLCEACDQDPDYATGKVTTRGYVVGDRFIPEKARVDPNPDKLIEQTVPIYLVEMGLEHFAPVMGAFDEENRLIYIQQVFPLGVDTEEMVRQAYVRRLPSVDKIRGVIPALDLAFRFATKQRELVEARRAELARKRQEEERREQALRSLGTGLGRRAAAVHDFDTAAKAALAVSGAELLDARPGRTKHEMVVQYRFENRRLECVVQKNTLQVIDAGVCLQDHVTQEKGDAYFTLESLPAVIRQAIKEHKLVVWRHVDGDVAGDDDDDWED